MLLVGISYLSRAQESAAKSRIGSPQAIGDTTKSSSAPVPSVADTIFVERIRTRVKNWKNACVGSSSSNGIFLAPRLIREFEGFLSFTKW